jgi:LPS-assembly lipoprotein
MSSSSALRLGLVVLALLVPLVLAGCSSFRPVYGVDGIATGRLALSYAKPASRLEQIIIQDLKLKLGSTNDAGAPRVTIRAAAPSRPLTRGTASRAMTDHEVVVTATYGVVANGKVVAEGSRRAAASYRSTGQQVLADESAYRDAAERAAREVAETIRLSIIADLATPVPEDDGLPQ